MTTLEILIASRELLREPSHWTQESGARDARGRSVAVNDDGAVSWCVLGAIDRVVGVVGEMPRDADARYAAITCLDTTNPIGDASTYNDTRRSHGVIMRWFNRAIRKARAEDGSSREFAMGSASIEGAV
jgi:hypothetical protein